VPENRTPEIRNLKLETVPMTWIKICGITNLEDALMAADAGADALGFVFYDQSLRKADVGMARAIVRQLPEKLEKVGVFVDQTAEEIREIVQKAALTAVQLHRKHSVESVWNDVRPSVECVGASKVIPVVPGDSLRDSGVLINQPVHEKIFALLLDAQSNGVVGGSGTRFDWDGTREMVQTISSVVRVIVAGGLNSTNVAEAVALFRPFGVDVSSGVEARPGKKDPDKVRAFVEAVRRADNK
jgi:phosphoribosylanthranilate isomerase